MAHWTHVQSSRRIVSENEAICIQSFLLDRRVMRGISRGFRSDSSATASVCITRAGSLLVSFWRLISVFGLVGGASQVFEVRTLERG